MDFQEIEIFNISFFKLKLKSLFHLKDDKLLNLKKYILQIFLQCELIRILLVKPKMLHTFIDMSGSNFSQTFMPSTFYTIFFCAPFLVKRYFLLAFRQRIHSRKQNPDYYLNPFLWVFKFQNTNECL